MNNVGFDLAKEVLRKHYTAKDLTPDWFRQFLLQPTNSHQAIQFASEYLIALHKPKSLGLDCFVALLFEASFSRRLLTSRRLLKINSW